MTVENEKAIRAVVRSAVEAYASGFSDRHLSEVDDEEGFDCIRYCILGVNRFVLHRYIPQYKEFLCLHQDTIEQEVKEIISFLKHCHRVLLTFSNGQIFDYPLSEFTFYSTLELEHNSKNIIINLSKDISHSFVYTTDLRGEIVDKQPITNITIY